MMIKKEIEEFIKLEILQIAGTVETTSEIQDKSPAAKTSKLGKYLGKSVVLV